MLACATAAAIAGTALVASSSSGVAPNSLRNMVGPAALVDGSSAPGLGGMGVSSPAKVVGRSRGYLTPPMRSLRSLPQKKSLLQRPDNESLPLRVAIGNGFHPDGALQSAQGKDHTPAPTTTFEGVNNLCSCYPPDTNGDVGANHYMQYVNNSFAIWDKNGNLVQAPRSGNTLFTGTPHCSTLGAGDPVVLYDQFAGRFVASDFAFASISTPPYYQCIAVSTTSDPTGSWCAYEFLVHNTKANDYPKLGVWPAQHAYMMTANQFLLGASYGGVGIWAFERDQMIALAARQPASCTRTWRRSTHTCRPRSRLTPTATCRRPPTRQLRSWPSTMDGSGLPEDNLQIWNATVTWGGSPSIKVTHNTDVQAAPFDSNLCDYGRGCIPQPGTSVKLDTLADRGDASGPVP